MAEYKSGNLDIMGQIQLLQSAQTELRTAIVNIKKEVKSMRDYLQDCELKLSTLDQNQLDEVFKNMEKLIQTLSEQAEQEYNVRMFKHLSQL